MRFVILILAVSVMCVSGAALAQQRPGRDACKEDVEKFCKDVQPGQGRLGKCLHEHEAELSEECKAAVAKAREHAQRMRERAQAIIEACRDDMKKFCEGVQPGHGRIVHCLKQNQAGLSEGCRNAMEQERRL